MSRDARTRMLDRVREALWDKHDAPHPGSLPPGLEPPVAFGEGGDPTAIEAFHERFAHGGGEVVRLTTQEARAAWLATFVRGFENVAVAGGVTPELTPALPEVPPHQADLGVSLAVGAAAQTGSLLLTSAGGRRPHLLPPVHLVWVRASQIHATLSEALLDAQREEGLPPTLALHSGPSKSADIGRIMVTGVHGPGRIVAAILEE